MTDYCDQVSLQHFSESEVRTRIDSIVKKAKGIYAQYRLPKETWRETDDADIALDEEAAKLSLVHNIDADVDVRANVVVNSTS